MNFKLMEEIGLGGLDITFVLIGILGFLLLLLVWLIVQTVKLSGLKKKYARFMSGKNARSLEKDIVGLYEDNKFIKMATDKNERDIKRLYDKLEGAYQKMGIVKYDAFNQMGGQLSFSLALLDEKDNGFILNSVHSTEGCYSYTKAVKKGVCDISLGEEEKKALDIAMGIEEG